MRAIANCENCKNANGKLVMVMRSAVEGGSVFCSACTSGTVRNVLRWSVEERSKNENRRKEAQLEEVGGDHNKRVTNERL